MYFDCGGMDAVRGTQKQYFDGRSCMMRMSDMSATLRFFLNVSEVPLN